MTSLHFFSSENPESKHIIAVLGMGRSGTSAVTRGLKTLGINLSGKHLAPNAVWNPKGFWEDEDIVLTNERMLLTLGYSWQSIGDISAKQHNNPALVPFAHEACALLQQRFMETNYWAFKDPRTCRLLPFWQQVFAQSNLTDSYIIVLRNPLSALESFSNIEFKMSHQQGLLLWLSSLIPAIAATQGKKRVVVEYELVMQDPCKQFARIKHALNTPNDIDMAEMEEYASQFLDKTLTHYEHTYEALQQHPQTPLICLQAYSYLCKLARDEISIDDPSFLQAWQRIQEKFSVIASAYEETRQSEA